VIEGSIHDALADSAREVLQRMFFVDLSAEVTDAGLGPPPAGIAAQVIFDGDPPGSFRLDLDTAVAQRVSADFLNEDEAELAPDRINEVVCELANMICGSVLSRIESSSTFRLAKPEIALGPTPEVAALLGASFQASLSGGALRAEIRMERPVCPGLDESAF
jgi:CheY-specific phosphatase CheX